MKRTNQELFKTYIMEALILLLEKRDFSKITVKEITDKAGVNRSTYYRNFDCKEDIILFFYTSILRKCISSDDLETHLTNVFKQFFIYKDELLCLHKNKLSYLLLTVLNSFFCQQQNTSNFNQDFEIYYHAGGVFNTLMLWFDQSMEIKVELLVKKSIEILPDDFKSVLVKK